jgi:hypothetical protein
VYVREKTLPPRARRSLSIGMEQNRLKTLPIGRYEGTRACSSMGLRPFHVPSHAHEVNLRAASRKSRREAMLIVSGRIYVRPGARQAFLASSRAAVAQARGARGCRDFVVAADPIEIDRVNVYEEWDVPA